MKKTIQKLTYTILFFSLTFAVQGQITDLWTPISAKQTIGAASWGQQGSPTFFMGWRSGISSPI